MPKRTMGFIAIAFGAIGIVVSLSADVIGIGNYPGINGAQLLGMAISFIIALGGVWLVLKGQIKKRK